MTGSQFSQLQAIPPQQNFLRAKQQIGSVKNGQLTYPKDQACFDRWDAENLAQNKTANIVRQVKHEIDRDLLGTKKPNWDQSVGTVGNAKAEEHGKTLFEIKKGLKDEKITRAKEQKVYAGCDTRDTYHTGWSVSTETVHPRDSERFLQAT